MRVVEVEIKLLLGLGVVFTWILLKGVMRITVPLASLQMEHLARCHVARRLILIFLLEEAILTQTNKVLR